jgi:hypothetical protein
MTAFEFVVVFLLFIIFMAVAGVAIGVEKIGSHLGSISNSLFEIKSHFPDSDAEEDEE